MKKIFLIAVFVTASITNAQSLGDALRLSTSDITGTARFRGLGGAFGALGGDLSAVGINPASSAVFTKGTVSFSIANDNSNNKTSYFGELTAVRDNNLDVNQAGGVFVIDSSSDSKWNKITLGFNYDRAEDFSDQFIAAGSGDTSISSYFNEFAQGVPLDLLETLEGESVSELYQFLGETEGFGAQQALLGFQSFIIDPVDGNDFGNTAYVVNTGSGDFDQEYFFSSNGFNGKASFNIGAQYDESLYVGLNLNSHFFEYNQNTVLFESSDSFSSGPTSIRQVRFENRLSTFGGGFSFQAGFIKKIQDKLRVGFTYDSSTWYTVSEEGFQNVRTVAEDDLGEFTTTVNPQVTNIFQNYQVKTPDKYTTSLAYIFGKQGLISLDYSYTDFTRLSFRPQGDPFFQAQNAAIDQLLTAASTFRAGGEYRPNNWSFRGGYRLQESPYQDKTTLGNLTGFSLGLGYNFGRTKLDLAYDRSEQDRSQALFTTGLTSAANITNTNTALVATLTLSY